jgi:soluble lytic murein transglycosylase-like protein
MHCTPGDPRPFRRIRLRVGLAFMMAAAGACTVLTQQPAHAQTALQAGWVAFQAGQMAQAQTAFAEAAASTPKSATPAVWMGAVLLARGNLAQAAHWFRLSLLSHPTPEQARYAIAWLGRLHAPIRQSAAKSVPARLDATTAEGITQFIRAANPAIAPRQAAWEGRAIREAAAHEGVDPRLMTALIDVESGFDQGAVSPVGAEGLGQLMPQTAAELGVNPHDPWQNLVGSAHLLRLDYAQFQSWPLTLAAYNAGGNAVRHYGGIPPFAETRTYVWKVLSIFGGLLV